MAKGKKVKELKRRDTPISIRLPGELLAKIDTQAQDEGRSRANLIKRLLEGAMQ